MPSYVPNSAVELVKRFVRNDRISDPPVWARIRQAASDYIWAAAPWRWTISRLGPIQTTASVSEYPVTLPGDFDYLVDAYLTDGRSTWRSLKPVPLIAGSEHQGEPVRISVSGSVLQIAPAPSVSGWRLYAYYKKTAPPISGSVPGELVMPDCWAWVYETAVLYYAYLYADDVRAGSAQVAINQNGTTIQYTGMRAMLESAVEFMRSREPMLVGQFRSSMG